MTRIALLALVALTFPAAGCRAVLGIEDLHRDDGGVATGDGGGGTDGGHPAAEAGTDAGARADGGVDAGLADDPCVREADCLRCCRDKFRDDLARLENEARTRNCLCGASTCQAECAAPGNVCTGGPPPDGGPGPMCVDCINRALRSLPTACAAALDACNTDTGCKVAAHCLLGCK